MKKGPERLRGGNQPNFHPQIFAAYPSAPCAPCLRRRLARGAFLLAVTLSACNPEQRVRRRPVSGQPGPVGRGTWALFAVGMPVSIAAPRPGPTSDFLPWVFVGSRDGKRSREGQASGGARGQHGRGPPLLCHDTYPLMLSTLLGCPLPEACRQDASSLPGSCALSPCP